MRISDWSSDVCSSDLQNSALTESFETAAAIGSNGVWINPVGRFARYGDTNSGASKIRDNSYGGAIGLNLGYADNGTFGIGFRSEEHTSELQSLMRISYAVFCLKKKRMNNEPQHYNILTKS